MTIICNNRIVCGIDVASCELVCRISVDNKVRCHENSRRGCMRLLKELQKFEVNLVILEHTGRHERLLLGELWSHNIAVHCAHPKAVHNFAKALRFNAKSDPIDAGILMEYGLKMNLSPTARPAQEILDLQEFTSRREELNETLVQEKNRLNTPQLPLWKQRSINNHIRYLQRELKSIEAEMKKLTHSHESLSKPIDCLNSEYGMGFIASATLYAHLPELGTINRQRVAALAGLAPFIRNSGKFQGQAKIYGGRTAARCALYMPALTVIRKKDHPMRHLYLRMKKANKPTNEALTAVMRKLLVRLNTNIKNLLASSARINQLNNDLSVIYT